MPGIKSFAKIAVVLTVLLVAAPLFAARGEADFTRFVALGDSYGAGVSNASLNDRHQIYSWPAIIARQAGAPMFVQPLVTYPGIGPEMELVDIISFPPVFRNAPGTAVVNVNYPAPWNNLSIPGAQVQHLTTLTGAQPVTNTPTAMAQFILRGQGTAVQQAVALNPTFIAIWIGGNDLLGAVLSGTPAALTSVDAFRTAYNAMLDQLVAGAPNAGMVVGNLPTNPGALPLTATVPPVIINPATRQPLLIGGNAVFLVADLGGGNIGQLPAGSIVLLTAAGKIAQGFGIPPTLATQPPFNQLPGAGQPQEAAALGYTFYMKRKVASTTPAAFKMFFERTGYRYADIYDQPLENHIMHGQNLVGKSSGYHVHMIRDFHGLRVNSVQDYSVTRSGNRTTISQSGSWWAPLSAPPRLRLQVAEKSLTGAVKAIKEAFSNSSRHWHQQYPVALQSGDQELDARFLFFGDDQNSLALLHAPGLKELLLGCAEVDLTVHQDRVVLNDPTQKNMIAGMGGQIGNMALGADMTKRMELTIPVHDRIAQILAVVAGAVR